jgi:hypothetical protein
MRYAPLSICSGVTGRSLRRRHRVSAKWWSNVSRRATEPLPAIGFGPGPGTPPDDLIATLPTAGLRLQRLLQSRQIESSNDSCQSSPVKQKHIARAAAIHRSPARGPGDVLPAVSRATCRAQSRQGQTRHRTNASTRRNVGCTRLALAVWMPQTSDLFRLSATGPTPRLSCGGGSLGLRHRPSEHRQHPRVAIQVMPRNLTGGKEAH